MNMDQDRHMLMVEYNVGNQFRPNAGQIAWNLNGYNAVQNVRNQVRQNAVQNSGIQTLESKWAYVVPRDLLNQNANQNGMVNVMHSHTKRRDATYLGDSVAVLAQRKKHGDPTPS
ncbi:hypothetical protein Tco_0267202 [Tanacetum coccineum]